MGKKHKLAVANPPKIDQREIGYTGTSLVQSQRKDVTFGGYALAQQDYNPELRGVLLYDEIDRMRMSDSIIGGVMRAYKLPLRQAEWVFEPGDETPEQEQIAEWLNNQLDQMNWTWDTVLRHILLYLDYGSMAFEVVFEIVDDPMFKRPMARLRKLAPRMPRTIIEYRTDERGGLAGIVQQIPGLYSTDTIGIPIEKLLVFVNELEGANWRGQSILRQARKDWFYKDRFQRLGGIIMEKRGAGVDVGTLTNGDRVKQNAAERVLMDVRTHERAFVLENEDFKYRIESLGSGGVLDPLPWVNYYDLSMLRGLLAEFIALGGSDAGSWALSRDKTSFFLQALRAIAGEICDTINRHLVRKWCDLNFANLNGVYPYLRTGALDKRDAAMVIDAITKLIPLSVLDADESLSKEVREILDLPEPDAIDVGSPPEPTNLPDPTNLPEPPVAKAATSRVDWAALEDGLNSAEARIVGAVSSIQKRQIDVLVREAMKRIDASKLDALDGISVPFKGEVETAITDVLIDIYRTGQREATKELKAAIRRTGAVRLAKEPTDPMSDSDVIAFLKVRAKSIASVLAERLRGSMLKNALDLFIKGDATASALNDRLTELSDRAIQTEASTTVSEAVNLGRASAAQENSEMIKRVEFSSVLDTRRGHETCDPCRDADGLTFQFGSAEMDAHQPPYKECHGRGRCRCVLVYVLEGEE